MNIRSLLLGSIAVAGLSTAGYAADLGVVTSLDVCDELGLSGLTISSDDNCLQISGNVSFEYNWGDYDNSIAYVDTGVGNLTVGVDNNNTDSDANTAMWLKFVGTASTDMGPAWATIKLLREDVNNNNNVIVDEAWVGIGDTTVIQAGYKSSIFNSADDKPLNYLGLFNSEIVDAGVGDDSNGAVTGGEVIQVVANLGNGLKVSGGLENLGAGSGDLTGVGVLAYAGDGLSAHVSIAADTNNDWRLHAGFQGTWDPVTIVAAYATDETGYFNALGSVSAKFDMFTLAASGEMNSDGHGVGGSLSATVTEGVTLNVGGRYFDNTTSGDTTTQVEAGVVAAITETITLSGAVGYVDSDLAATSWTYAKGSVAWAPGGGFTSSLGGEINSEGGYKATFKAAKSIK